jgi:hypothetical protein
MALLCEMGPGPLRAWPNIDFAGKHGKEAGGLNCRILPSGFKPWRPGNQLQKHLMTGGNGWLDTNAGFEDAEEWEGTPDR